MRLIKRPNSSNTCTGKVLASISGTQHCGTVMLKREDNKRAIATSFCDGSQSEFSVIIQGGTPDMSNQINFPASI